MSERHTPPVPGYVPGVVFEAEPGGAIILPACPWPVRAAALMLDLWPEPRPAADFPDGLLVAVQLRSPRGRRRRGTYVLGTLRHGAGTHALQLPDGSVHGPVPSIAGLVVGAMESLGTYRAHNGNGLTLPELLGAAA